MNQTEIILLRKALKWSQEELARKLGVSFATVNRWENGDRKPSPNSAKLLRLLAEGKEIKTWPRLNRPEIHPKYKAKKK
jgi:DNA-binding transcriptional regulator YiaG